MGKIIDLETVTKKTAHPGAVWAEETMYELTVAGPRCDWTVFLPNSRALNEMIEILDLNGGQSFYCRPVSCSQKGAVC